MARQSTSADKELADMTECSICTEVFTDPRVLPCDHAFCLKCMLNYGKDRRPGDRMPCPLCRKEFSIPDDGLSGMKKSFIVEKLLQVRKLSAGKTMCEQHKSEEIKVFCQECRVGICVMCLLKSHKTHDCADIEELSDNLCNLVVSDTHKVSELWKISENVLQRLEKEKNDVMKHLAGVQNEINTAADKLIADIQRDKVKLLSEVELIKLKRVKQVETVKQEVEQHMRALKSFKKDRKTLLSSGTACDVTRSANSLQDRADKLMKFDVIGHVDSSLPPVSVTFTPSTLLDRDVRNLVGTVQVASSTFQTGAALSVPPRRVGPHIGTVGEEGQLTHVS